MVTTQQSLVIRRALAASPEKVFSAWTNPEQMQRWFGPSAEYANPFIEVDLRVGGEYRIGFHNAATDHSAVAFGEYVNIEPGRKLVMTWQWEPPNEHAGAATLLTVEFLPCEAGCELVLTHERIPAAEMRESHSQGWNGMLDRLPEVLAPA